jgi:winged helix DNA-binding protein
VSERVLTLRELNRATLARQLLLERRRVSPLATIERLAGMQAQWPSAPYVGLWSRVAGFRRDALERALRRGEVLKATLMRGTLHLVTRRDYAVFAAGVGNVAGWLDHPAHADGERVAPAVRELAETAPLRMVDALAFLEREHGLVDQHARRVWHVARVRAHLLHAPETALWGARPQALYVAVDSPEPVDLLAARTEVVRRYLAAFGPAARADLADWSGLRVGEVAAALDALEPLARLRDERGRELLDLPRRPLPRGDVPAPVRFMPKWDNLILGYADRTRVLPEEYRKAVIAKNGDVAQTFLVDGLVAGTWRVEKGKVVVEPFAPLPLAARRDVEEEARRLEAWLA